jgi:hypothetical protein
MSNISPPSSGSKINPSRTLQQAAHARNYVELQFISKAIPVTGRGGPCGCETSRLPRFLDNRLADGGEVVRLTLWSLFTPQEDSWYSFLLEAESTPGP